MMGEIIYFDANDTIRQMMVKQLKTYGLDVVEPKSLDRCEEVLKRCQNPVVIILDMTRNPEQLPSLQGVIPEYLNDPERCILTTTAPTSLAKYLTRDVSSCFFKHVVERPFKRLEFIRFVEGIIKPYMVVPELKSREPAGVSVLNSSVSQIVGEDVGQTPEDKSFSQQVHRQVERIVQDVSVVRPLSELEPPPPPPPMESPEDSSPGVVQRLSRSSRARAAGGRFSREGSWSRLMHESSQSNPAIQAVPQNQANRQPSGIRPSVSRDGSPSSAGIRRVSRSDSFHRVRETHHELVVKADESSVEQPGAANRTNTVEPQKSVDPPVIYASSEIQAIDETAYEEEEEEENTILISPSKVRIVQSAPPKVLAIPVASPLTDSTFNRLGTANLISLIQHSSHFGVPIVMVCHGDADEIVVIMHSGLMMWIESVRNGEICSAERWLRDNGFDARLPMPSLMAQLDNGLSFNDALSGLNRDSVGIDICNSVIEQGMRTIAEAQDIPYSIYDSLPAEFGDLVKQRPMFGVNVIPDLYKKIRDRQESSVISERFKNHCFVRRPYRTPLNASISLTESEVQLLEQLKSPATLSDLATATPDAEHMVYRMLLFELIDCTA